MAKADLMRNHIACTFKKLLQTNSYSGVTVQDIANEADISRKTFYYHFFNKSDLVKYIFRADLANELKRLFPTDELVCDTGLREDKYRYYPFFTRDYFGEHDKKAFFNVFSRYIGKNSDYYQKLFRCEDWNYLENYLIEIYRPRLKKIIASFFAEYKVEAPAEIVDYLASYYAHSTVLWVLHRHVTKQRHYSEETKDYLGNLFYDNIHNSVEIQARRLLEEQGRKFTE